MDFVWCLLCFLFLFVPEIYSECPDMCSCSIQNLLCETGRIVDLGPLLRSVDEGIQSIRITAPKNRPNELQLGPLFQDFKNLRSITITHSQIPAIGPGVFIGMVRVRKLDLSWNDITALKIEAFKGLYDLKELYLDHNKIESIPSAGFRNVHNLEVLDLSYNKLKELVTRMLFLLQRLQHLNLSGNPLGRLDPEILKDVQALKRLECRDCRIDAFPPELSQLLPSLTVLDLGKNRIPLLDPSHLRNLVNLKELYLDGNFLRELQAYTFSGLYLNTLSLSRNEFKGSLPRHTFFNCSVRHLDLSYNRLRNVDNKFFRPIRNNLLSLNISGNHLSNANLKKVIPPLIHLRRLELSNMRLDDLADETLRGLDHLTRLNLSHNDFQHVPYTLQYVMGSLDSLDISYNRIEGLTSEMSLELSLTRFKSVVLEGNPWVCDACGHARLKNVINMTRQRELCPADRRCVTCASPNEAQGFGVGLYSVPEGIEDCGLDDRSSKLLLSRPTYLGILLGCAALVALCVVALLAAIMYNARHSARYYTHEDQGGRLSEEEAFLYPSSDYYITEKKPSVATIEDYSRDPLIPHTHAHSSKPTVGVVTTVPPRRC
ncbi:unnamed protein product [Cyprideis torosa]|uniref:Uncharacterized protein n=1 Tax=Cyprideis torosa TaxID=163714 RepID=A0A7R8W3V5_9CRUS|nr:unnamed protein product [Cyprideis torosa]CAG0879298.1 unnamed protein product [Cyprideis torosa]